MPRNYQLVKASLPAARGAFQPRSAMTINRSMPGAGANPGKSRRTSRAARLSGAQGVQASNRIIAAVARILRAAECG